MVSAARGEAWRDWVLLRLFVDAGCGYTIMCGVRVKVRARIHRSQYGVHYTYIPHLTENHQQL
jgi:hypothetical protein